MITCRYYLIFVLQVPFPSLQQSDFRILFDFSARVFAMPSPSEPFTAYEYPDPDDLDHGTSFAWAGNDNDHIPEALKEASSRTRTASETGYNYNFNSLPSHISPQEHENPASREAEDVPDFSLRTLPFDDG